MWLGIPYIAWLGILGAIAIFLIIRPKRKEQQPNVTQEQLDAYISDVMDMRWFKVEAPSEQVPEVLNRIEVAKITVMYQFFLNQQTGLYDLFFRCRRAELDKMKDIMKDFA